MFRENKRMTRMSIWLLLFLVVPAFGLAQTASPVPMEHGQAELSLPQGSSPQNRALRLDRFFYETAQGRIILPALLTDKAQNFQSGVAETQARMADGRTVTLSLKREGSNFVIRLSAQPDSGITKWGLAVDVLADEYYTGLMERVVDGPQRASWEPGLKAAMDLRGQKVDMILKPTTSIYAPFYLSSRGYAMFVKGLWPGFFDFAASDAQRVKVEFEGPSFEIKVYMSDDPMELVREHAMDAGPPILPPKWMFTPWRWRDEHSQLPQYYDGTPVTGPFNSQVMEDVLLMDAFGIPDGVYWIDRPWGPGRLGYDDFEIDAKRLPNFPETIQWMNERHMQMMLWIAPFYQGNMEKEALAKGYTLPGQKPQPNNYPLVDLTNPAARAYWQDGVAKLFKMGVAGFKMDRAEEDIPDDGPFKVFDGRSLRENRNAYPVMYLKATYDVAQKYRGDDVVLMPRAAYTGSAPYGEFWAGDITGTQEGLRAAIIAGQRSAVMGYPNWGSDTCGYGNMAIEQEVCGRWLAFSAFTPIMEVGPTDNVGFWNLPHDRGYDATLIAIWRLYARVHQHLIDYSYKYAQVAHETGTPIMRPVFLVDPKSKQAWSSWQTYLYGPDLLVSPIWEKGKRTQQVYLPAGEKWRDAWHPDKIYQGGQTVTVAAELQQMPLFLRVGSSIDLGDLNREYQESLAIAQKKPDLKVLDAEVAKWFAKRQQGTAKK
jgi:alpha-glucosidase (family GH31 glycosyl hydrolase)